MADDMAEKPSSEQDSLGDIKPTTEQVEVKELD